MDQFSKFHKAHKSGCGEFLRTVAILTDTCIKCLEEGISQKHLSASVVSLEEFVIKTLTASAVDLPNPVQKKCFTPSLGFSRYSRSLMLDNEVSVQFEALATLISNLCHKPWLNNCLNIIVTELLEQGIAPSQIQRHVHFCCLRAINESLPLSIRAGFLIPVSAGIGNQVAKRISCPLKAVLMVANLRESHHHLGYEDDVRLKVQSTPSFEVSVENSANSSWRYGTRELFKDKGIGVIMLTGTCCPLLRLELENDGFLLLEKFPLDLMENLSEMFNVETIEYPSDLKSNNTSAIIPGIRLHMEVDDVFDANGSQLCVLEAEGKTFKTVCFRNTLPNADKIAIEEFSHELHRIQSSLTSLRVLQGSGVAEENLVLELESESEIILQKNVSTSSSATYVLYSTFASVLRQYVNELRGKTWRPECENEDANEKTIIPPWDAYDPRIASFQSAFATVCCLLNINQYVVTTDQDFSVV